MKPEPPPLWTAWFRPKGKRWRAIAHTRTEDEAWKAIYQTMDEAGPGAYDGMVLRKGDKP